MIRINSRLAAISLAALALAISAGCSSGNSHASAAASPSGNDQQRALAIGRDFADCARAHGRPNFPDPRIRNNSLSFPGASKDDTNAVWASCGSILQQLPASMQQQDQTPSAQDMVRLQQFAQCLRQHGVPDWPDPKPDGTFPIVGTPLETEGKSQRIIDAEQACRQYFDGGINAS